MSELATRVFEEKKLDASGTDSDVYFKGGEVEKLYDRKALISWPEVVWVYADILNKTAKLGPWSLGKVEVLEGESKWDVVLSVNSVYSTFIIKKADKEIPTTSSPLVNGINYLELRTKADISRDLDRMKTLGADFAEIQRIKKIHEELMKRPIALAGAVDLAKAKIKKSGKRILHLDPFFFQDINCMVTSPSDKKIGLIVTDLGMSIRDISSQILTPGRKISM